MPTPFDDDAWKTLTPETGDVDSFIASRYLLLLLKKLANETGEAAAAVVAELKKWGLDGVKLSADQDLLKAAAAFDLCEDTHMGDSHLKITDRVRVFLGMGDDDPDFNSCASVNEDDEDDARQSKPAAAGNPTDNNNNEHPADGGAATESPPPTGGEGNIKKDKKKNEKKNEKKANEAEKKQKADKDKGKDKVGKKKGESDKKLVEVDDAKKLNGKKSWLEAVKGKQEQQAAKVAKAAEDIGEVDASNHRAAAMQQAVPNVPLFTVNRHKVAAAAGLKTGAAIPLATAVQVEEAIALSEKGLDLMVVDDIRTNCPTALMTTAAGRVLNVYERASQIKVIRDGVGKSYIILRGLLREKCKTGIEERCKIVQAEPAVSVDQLAPNPNRGFAYGPAALFRGAGVSSINRQSVSKAGSVQDDALVRVEGDVTNLRDKACLSCTVEQLGSKAWAPHRLRLKLERGMEATARLQLGLTVQARDDVAGTYVAGQDLVVVLKNVATDVVVKQLGKLKGVYAAWAELPPIPVGKRADPDTPDHEEVKRVKAPTDAATKPVLLNLVSGTDIKQDVVDAITSDLGGICVEGNFQLLQLHLPVDKFDALSTKISTTHDTYTITHHSASWTFLVEAAY